MVNFVQNPEITTMKKNKRKNRIKRRSKKLWTIPQPEVHTFEGRGYENLYHFTYGDKLYDIFKYGIIFGDVIVDMFDGFNTPNLTTEGRYHCPPKQQTSPEWFVKRGGLIRLSVNCSKDPKKLINYGWFDTVYCNGITKSTNLGNEERFGDIDKQYIYLGHIDQSMIGGVKVWNRKSKSWDRLRKQELDSLCKEYEELPYQHKLRGQPNQLRMSGLQLNDYTGKLKQYYSENDYKDIYRCFYSISDFLCNSFKHSPMKYRDKFTSYKRFMVTWSISGRSSTLNGMIELLNYLIDLFNTVVPESEQLDPNPIIQNFCYEFLEWEKWLDQIEKDSTEDYEEQLKLVS